MLMHHDLFFKKTFETHILANNFTYHIFQSYLSRRHLFLHHLFITHFYYIFVRHCTCILTIACLYYMCHSNLLSMLIYIFHNVILPNIKIYIVKLLSLPIIKENNLILY